MGVRRWPWLVSAALLFGSGIASGVTTYWWWLPCKGQMLPGVTEFTDACLVRMDSGTPYPLPVAVEPQLTAVYALGSAAMVLAALAWLAPVLASSWWGAKTKALGASFSIALVGLAWVGLYPVERNEGAGWLDYMVTSSWNSPSWDMPPGAGYLNAGGLVVAAIAVTIVTLLQSRPADDLQRPVALPAPT